MARSKFSHVTAEGVTTDGRTRKHRWISGMAASYNPNTSVASRVNPKPTCALIRAQFQTETMLKALAA